MVQRLDAAGAAWPQKQRAENAGAQQLSAFYCSPELSSLGIVPPIFMTDLYFSVKSSLERGWRVGSVVKMTCCSCGSKGPGVRFPPPTWGGSTSPQSPAHVVQTYMKAKLHIHKMIKASVKRNFFWKYPPQTCPEVCLLGDSRSCQSVLNIRIPKGLLVVANIISPASHPKAHSLREQHK